MPKLRLNYQALNTITGLYHTTHQLTWQFQFITNPYIYLIIWTPTQLHTLVLISKVLQLDVRVNSHSGNATMTKNL